MKNQAPAHNKSKQTKSGETVPENRDKQGVDKMPEQEKGKAELITSKNLKGKQVDEDPETEEGKPLEDY
ncbi:MULTISPECIES: hypothetical protein [Niastella]|uniref:Uncharacterized protein n=1 Tax=Niastella soli TaxID=2821487 RepID=A0ABS3Z1L3_9BACT|nr:hypothetical protein [Niastella soli]MBO9203923.1 hypothetical protein [Niastella soli]